MRSEVEFWKWFREHEELLYNAKADDESLFNDVRDALSKVHPDLTFELGISDAAKREFIVSAGGIVGAFPAVRSLTAAAPAFDRWRIIAFRQRKPSVGMITVAGLSLFAEDVLFTLETHDAKMDVTLYLPGYSKDDHSKFLTIGFLLLDAALGEYDVEMGLGTIELARLDDDSPTSARPIAELAAAFDRFASSKN